MILLSVDTQGIVLWRYYGTVYIVINVHCIDIPCKMEEENFDHT